MDVSVSLELNHWNGSVEPRVVLGRALRRARGGTRPRSSSRPTPARARSGGAGSTPRSWRPWTAGAAARGAGGPPRGRRPPRALGRGDRRRAGLQRRGRAGGLRRRRAPPGAGRARRTPGPVRRRRRWRWPARASPTHRARRRCPAASRSAAGGVALADWPRLERDPALAAGFEHVVLIDPPPLAGLEATRRPLRAPASCTWPGGGRGRVRAARSGRRSGRRARPGAPCIALWASSPDADGMLAGEELRARSRARAPIRARPRWRHAPCACWRSSGSFAPGRTVPARRAEPRASYPRRATDLARSQAFTAYRARCEEGRRYLSRRRQPSRRENGVGAPTAVHTRVGRERRARAAPAAARRRDHEGARRRRAGAPRRPARGRRRARRRGAAAVDREAVERAVRVRLRAPRRPAPPLGRGLHHPPGRGREDLRRACASTPRRSARPCCTTRSRTPAPASRRWRSPSASPIAQLVDGVTKLTEITFQSRDEHQAENYRKMMVAMATDVRVILIKLADRLHNMRTLEALPKQKQLDKARETLEIYAPLAHRLGIHAIKWELEDLAFARLHPRKYDEIKKLVAQQRDRARGLRHRGGRVPAPELAKVGIEAEISGRAKHFYSIYSKMTKKGREFNEIYDLTAMRVIVGSVKDCYGAIGIIHSIWKPLPGRFKDFVATPKLNLYSALHTTVIGPEGRPLEIQLRTADMHELAEYGIAAHVIYKEGPARSKGDPDRDKMIWLRQLLEAEGEQEPGRVPRGAEGRPVRGRGLRLHAARRGQEPLRRLDPARLRLRGAHRRRPPLRRRQGERQDRAAPLPAARAATSSRSSPPSRSAAPPATGSPSCARTAPATRSAPSSPASAARTPSAAGREELQTALRKRGLPMQRIAGSPLLADVIREMGFRKGDDFYIALGPGQDLLEDRHREGLPAPEAGRGRRRRRDRGPARERPRGPRRAPAPHPGRERATGST